MSEDSLSVLLSPKLKDTLQYFLRQNFDNAHTKENVAPVPCVSGYDVPDASAEDDGFVSKRTLRLGMVTSSSYHRPLKRRKFIHAPNTSHAHHVDTHTRFFCPHRCKKKDGTLCSYKVPQGLRHHLKSFHEKTKDFECSECFQRFASKGLLKIHMRTHTGEKPFTCNECDRAFTQSGQLTKHKVSRHNNGGFPFVCMIDGCQVRFPTKRAYHVHVSDIHPSASNLL